MNSRLLLVFGIWCLEFSALGQPTPHIGYVYPAGGREGTTVQLTIGGQFLEGVSAAFVSGSGVQASIVDFTKPMNQGEFNRIRDRFRELEDKRQTATRMARRGEHIDPTNAWTSADEKALNELKQKVLKNPPNRQATVAISENVIIRLNISSSAGPGERELRVQTPIGVSNPLKFLICQLPEFSQPTAKAANPDLDRFLERLGRLPVKEGGHPDLHVTLPSVVNGQIMPGAVDRFRFHARKGQSLVATVRARDLIPYLADAVPGWFQAALTLYDSKGKELAYNDDFRFHPDPVLHYEVASDGDYVLELKDALYRGREDFVYRLSVGELPFITSIFPLGGPAAKATTVHLTGWNLPTNSLVLRSQGSEAGTLAVSVSTDDKLSNVLPFALGTLPEVNENEPNDAPGGAEKVFLPVIINGVIAHPGDADVFSFAGKAGDELVADVHARRLESPLDSKLTLLDNSGNKIAFDDDCEDKACGLNTHHADSYLRTRLPGDGLYFILLEDSQQKGGEEYAYRLRLSAPQPDFELRVTPSAVAGRPGLNVPLTVYASRKDGFTNEIILKVLDAPRGLSLSGGLIPSGQEQVRVTISIPLQPSDEPPTLNFEGRATINGKPIVLAFAPADDMMQAFAYHHLVPARELQLAVLGRGMGRQVKLVGETPVKIPVNGKGRIQFSAPQAAANRFQFELSDPPEGIKLAKGPGTDQLTELILQTDAKAKPGTKGNLIVNVFASAQNSGNKKQAPQKRILAGTLPAIPFEVVP